MNCNTTHYRANSSSVPGDPTGFTLAEVAIATGIAAGVLAILTMVVGALSRDVQRLKPHEAYRRPAFVNSGAPSASSTPPPSSTSTTNNTTPSTTPTVSLPDANLDPSKRPDATQPPPDPNAPPPTTPASGTTGSTSGSTGSTSP